MAGQKVAVVTGAGQGIGFVVAQQMLAQGYRVVLAEADERHGRWAVDHLGHPEAILVVTDVSDEQSVAGMVERTMDQFGRIDRLVNNAGLLQWPQVPIEQFDLTQWQRVIQVNLTGAFICAKHCAAQLRQHAGAIVNIASTRALMSIGHDLAYAASKAGLVGLTHALAMHLGPDVRVNSICPGWIDTSGYRADGSRDQLRPIDHQQHPAGRVGEPADIAAMVVYLCSDAAGFITGSNFVIDGGMTRKMIYID